jgi:hypothetical protein
LSPTDPLVRNYHPADQQFLFETQEVWNTNWKCLVENFMEGYHLSPLHLKTLHPVTPTILCEKLPDGPAFTGYRANFHPDCPERGPYHADLTLQERRSDVFYCVYPSFVVGFCPHFTLYMCIRPLTVDTVGIRWGVTGNPADPKSPEVESYVRSHTQQFVVTGGPGANKNQYELTERVGAGYVMNSVDLSARARLVAGVRVESTHVDTLSFNANTGQKDFKAGGMCARGWVVLAYDPTDGRLHNFIGDAQNQGGVWGTQPLLPCDTYEHSYFIDFGSDRAKYLAAFMSTINWPEVNRRYLAAVNMALAKK